jgi:hypothetical protein
MTDEMRMTVVTPIMMPSMVRPERSLLVRSVSMAILIASLVSASLIAYSFYNSERKATMGSSRAALRAG